MMRIVCLIFLSSIFFSCKYNSNQELDKSYFVSYAKTFSITKKDKYYLLKIIDPDKKRIVKEYVLYNKDIPKLTKNQIALKIPIQSIACLSGTDIGMLSVLNLQSRVGAVSNLNYVYNKDIIAKKNKILEIPSLNDLNPERILGKCDLISYASFGNDLLNENKFEKLKITCFPNYDWREQHPLGKAEWVKVYGLLFNKLEVAENYFNKIENRYKEKLKKLNQSKSTLKIFSGSIIGDFWYLPGGQSYNAKLFKDAGFDYVLKENELTGSQAFSVEKALAKFNEIPIWVNVGFKSKADLLNSNKAYKHLAAFKNGNIYCYAHQMNRFWELSAVMPDKVLSDLIEIKNADEKEYLNLYFYKKLK